MFKCSLLILSGIDIVDSFLCGLKAIFEVFTWTPRVLPKKVTLEDGECLFSAEFLISLREKKWKRGEFFAPRL